MQSGKLRTLLTLNQKSVTQNASGEDVVTWAELGTYYADIHPLTGREVDQVGQRWAEAQFRVTARVRSDITIQRADQFIWGSRTLDILGVEDVDQRGRELLIYAKEFTS